MQLKWGTYAFDSNSAKIAFALQTLINAGGQPYAQTKRIDVDGFLAADGQAAIQIAASALATALARPYQDLVLYRDDGTASDTALYNAPSTTGVVIQGLAFPDSRGGEYATFRRFTFFAEAEYPITNSVGLLMSFREKLSFSGGGPIYRHRMALNGKPQKQMVYADSIYKATQDGEAVGYLSRPNVQPPIWPDALMQSPDVDMESPQRRGRLYTDFRVTWRYNFESDAPLIGTPNVWK